MDASFTANHRTARTGRTGRCRVTRRLALAAACIFATAAARPAAAALAALTGGKPQGETGGDISINKSIRHQQFIADPSGTDQGGTTSVLYEPGDVSLQSVYQLTTSPPFQVNGGYVGVSVNGQSVVETLSDFFAHPGQTETGYVQVQWAGGTGITGPYGARPDSSSGYADEGSFGSTPAMGGDDTFGLQFGIIDPASSVKYTIEEDATTYQVYDFTSGKLTGADNQPDSYTATVNGMDYTYDSSDTELESDTVDDTPEPASLALSGVGALALLARRRRFGGVRR